MGFSSLHTAYRSSGPLRGVVKGGRCWEETLGPQQPSWQKCRVLSLKPKDKGETSGFPGKFDDPWDECYIYLRIYHQNQPFIVGKYTSPKDPMGNAWIGTIKDKGTPVELCWASDTKRDWLGCVAGVLEHSFCLAICWKPQKEGWVDLRNMVPNNQLLMWLMWYLNFERISLRGAVGTSSIRWGGDPISRILCKWVGSTTKYRWHTRLTETKYPKVV